MKLSEALAMGKSYTWGPIVRCIEVGPYAFLEHKARVYENNCGTDRFQGTEYSLFVDGEEINRGASTLESAMAQVLAYKYDGPNSQAAQLFLRMIGFEKERTP